jgi:crotonobetainyl-CoA:carnitine CoA-transferase CaiB-like acyl-CoA transferase
MNAPLAGITVIEMGQLIAGPFTTTLLAWFGAEVIKIEPPAGDPIRHWRLLDETGTSWWWYSIGRNKKSVTLNLKNTEQRILAKRLIEKADVLVENFRPGTMENWGLGPDDFKNSNPDLIYTRISGYGQTGPFANKPGYASVCEGFGGFRYLNGFPGEAPVRPNLSMGDTLAAIHAALGTVMALFNRERKGGGQVVDVAIFEAVFNLLESAIPEYAGAGVIREPSGTTLTGIVPTNTYQSRDGKYLIIGGNGDSIFKRLMQTAGRPDLAEDPRLAHNPGRVEHEAEIDEAIAYWCSLHDADKLLALLEEANVPSGPILNVADILTHPQYRARELLEGITINGKPLTIPAFAPRLSRTPGKTQWPGPELGAHNEEVLGGLLGLSEDELQQLQN